MDYFVLHGTIFLKDTYYPMQVTFCDYVT